MATCIAGWAVLSTAWAGSVFADPGEELERAILEQDREGLRDHVLEHGADWESHRSPAMDGLHPLSFAIRAGRTESALTLIELGCDLQEVGADGLSPVLWCARVGDAVALQSIRGAGVSLSCSDLYGRGVAHLVALRGDVEMFGSLGTELRLGDEDSIGRTPLHYAAMADDAGRATRFILTQLETPERGRQALLADANGMTPVHFASLLGRSESVRVLVEELDPDSLDVQSSSGRTALHCAVQSSSLATIGALLESGASPGIEDRIGRDAVEYFSSRSDLERAASEFGPHEWAGPLLAREDVELGWGPFSRAIREPEPYAGSLLAPMVTWHRGAPMPLPGEASCSGAQLILWPDGVYLRSVSSARPCDGLALGILETRFVDLLHAQLFEFCSFDERVLTMLSQGGGFEEFHFDGERCQLLLWIDLQFPNGDRRLERRDSYWAEASYYAQGFRSMIEGSRSLPGQTLQSHFESRGEFRGHGVSGRPLAGR